MYYAKYEVGDTKLIRSLIQEQDKLREQIVIEKPEQDIKVIAGCDCAIMGDRILSAFVNLTFPNLELLQITYNYQPLAYPYIPGLLAFREIPSLLKSYSKLKIEPDIIMVDGNGILHPRRMGIATHLGIKLSKSTFGVAKNKLCGSYQMPGIIKGDYSEVTHKGELIAYALRSKDNIKPIFVSPGHLCDFDTALSTTLATLIKHKLPEPTRLADYYSREYKHKIKIN